MLVSGNSDFVEVDNYTENNETSANAQVNFETQES